MIEHYSAFAGRIFPILSKLVISPQKAKQIFHGIQTVARLDEWIMIIAIGWATVPLIRFRYEHMRIGISKRGNTQETIHREGVQNYSSSAYLEGDNIQRKNEESKLPFEKTFICHLANHISQAGKIAALVYGIDCAIIAIKAMGFTIPKEISQCAPQAIYTAWMFFRLMKWKRFVVTRAVFAVNKGELEGKKNRAEIANKISDLIIVAIGLFFLMDLLHVNTGITLKSFFAVGGAGTVLLSFASKDLAMAFVSGLALQASDKLFEGDTVKFNGIIGHVDHIVRMQSSFLQTFQNSD